MKTTGSEVNIRRVKCPQCGKIVPWSDESPHRPFCSKRCQMIDFGDWASEKNRIPVEEPPTEFSPEPGSIEPRKTEE